MKWLLIISITVLASCRIERKIYSPLPVNNPSLQEKNDFSVVASISDPKAFDINGGFAVTDRFALIAGGYTHHNTDVETNTVFTSHYDSSNLSYRHKGFTLGAGTYFPLSGGKQASSYLSFFAGISKGRFKMNEEFYQIDPAPTTPMPVLNHYTSKLDRYFLQGSINFYSDFFEGALTTRYVLVNYEKVKTDYTDAQLSDYRLPPMVSPHLNSFIDLGFDVKVFFSRDLRLGIQFFGLISARINKEMDDAGNKRFYDYYPYRMGTGIFSRFSNKN